MLKAHVRSAADYHNGREDRTASHSPMRSKLSQTSLDHLIKANIKTKEKQKRKAQEKERSKQQKRLKIKQDYDERQKLQRLQAHK